MARGLGRGFGSLIPTEGFDEEFDPTAEEDKKVSDLKELTLDSIEPDPDQPRRTFDETELQDLSNSIKALGVIQPIVVIREGKKYVIVAGERRWRAARMAGLETIPAVVRTMNSQNRLEASLIENVQRQDLNPIETATAYAKLREQFNMNVNEIADRIGKSSATVSNTMRLLSLPDEAKRAMIEFKLKEGQMRPLASATPEEIKEVLPFIIKENWSARKVEQYMVTVRARRQAEAEQEDGPKKKPVIQNDPVRIESERRAEAISAKIGVKVRVRTSTKGSGKIMLDFKDEKEFERLCTILTT
jgi:ParB family chromosome partitioning protein